MKATDMVSKITNFMDSEKEVFVYLFGRDENGCVIEKTAFPVDAVFAHERGEIKIYIESSESNTINL